MADKENLPELTQDQVNVLIQYLERPGERHDGKGRSINRNMYAIADITVLPISEVRRISHQLVELGLLASERTETTLYFLLPKDDEVMIVKANDAADMWFVNDRRQNGQEHRANQLLAELKRRQRKRHGPQTDGSDRSR